MSKIRDTDGVKTKRKFPPGYVTPAAESLVDAPCTRGGVAHRPNGNQAACGAQADMHGFRTLSYYAAIEAGATACRRTECFPHLESVKS